MGDEIIDRAKEIGGASTHLRHHGLTSAAAWLTEQFLALENRDGGSFASEFAEGRRVAYDILDHSQTFTAGRNYLALKEYSRAAACFEQCTSIGGLFMKYYARYLALQRHERQQGGLRGDELQLIRVEIERHVFGPRLDNPLIYYLYGRLTRGQKSIDALVTSIRDFPCHWTAWKELLKHVKSVQDYEQTMGILPRHWVREFFDIEALIQIRQYQKALHKLRDFQRVYPHSLFFYSALARCMYHTGQHGLSLTFFNTLLNMDPERTEDMEVYASLLYVLNKKVELNALAQSFLEKKKFTSEACCILGHHYSLKQNPAKAIEFFRRAVRLDEDCLNARMYMAQEYMEQRDHAQALEELDQVICRDQTNARAWHLRGQAYELGGVLSLAEKSFTEACCLEPHEGAMWLSRGICNFNLGNLQLAETCLKHATKEGCKDGTAKTFLGKVRQKLHPEDIQEDGEETEISPRGD